jgi:hypothetical protein
MSNIMIGFLQVLRSLGLATGFLRPAVDFLDDLTGFKGGSKSFVSESDAEATIYKVRESFKFPIEVHS